jgi:hypothetical protein
MTPGDREQVRQLAITLARDLGAGWALDTKGDYDWMHAIRRRDGARISINGAVRPGRFWVSGHSNCPDYPISDGGWGIRAPSITVSAARSDPDIVRDIKRRFLPRFLEAFREARGKQLRLNQQRAATRRVASTLTSILDAEIGDPCGRDQRRGDTVPVYSTPYSIEALCTFENVDFRVRSASPALAIRLAKVVAEYRRQEMEADVA